MKYLIIENKVNEIIKKELDRMFNVEEINSYHPYEYNDETGEEFEDSTRIEFYFGDYGDDDTVFRWYDKDYWGENPDNYIGYTSKSPLVEIEEPYHSFLNGQFGKMWYQPFKEWFEENFRVPVKSVIDEIYLIS